MASSKTFVLQNGVTIEKIGDHLISWFQSAKKMVAEGAKTQDGGFFVQAKDPDEGWKKISGLSKAIQVQLIKADNNVVVNCDFGKWSDKIGAGAVGMILFAPLAATAAFGAVKQSQLPKEVFEEIEKFIMCGGSSAALSIGAVLRDNEIECPVCKAKNPKDQKFCRECGSALRKKCPHCGALLDNGVKFCPECGNSTVVSTVCIKCGAPLEEGQAFCPSCGAKQEMTCPSCGAAITTDTKFCPSCGASLSEKKLCPNCKAELQPNAAFCPECGTKIN